MSTSRTFAAGAVLTAAQMNDLAQGLLGYVQVTANQGSITAEVDATSLTLTITTVAGRRIKVTGQCYMSNTGAVGTNVLKIFQDGVQIQEGGHLASTNSQVIHISAVVTPTAASHTWKLRVVATAGTGTLGASATIPAFILVEDIGV